MNPELCKAALQFLSRVNLNAQEIPAFEAVVRALTEEAEAGETVEPDVPAVE